jgi:transcriptional regulator with XRE-family HTH domain
VSVGVVNGAVGGVEIPPGMVTIKERREQLGWTQWELAAAVGVSGPIISMWERHLYGPSERYRQTLADALDVELEDLFLQPPKKAGRPPIYDYTVRGSGSGAGTVANY